MTDPTVQPLLRRKIGARRAAPDIGRMSPLKGWRMAFAKAGPEAAELEIGVRLLDEAKLGLEALAAKLSETSLLMLMEGPDSRFGLVAFEAPVTASVIEAQTLGRVTAGEGEPRPPTRTDAIMVADLVDKVHELFEVEAASLESLRVAFGFRYAMPLENARAVTLTLDDRHYRVWTLVLDLGGGVTSGEVILAYPMQRSVPRPVENWAATLERSLEQAETEIEAVIAQPMLSFEQLADLLPGDIIPLPRETLGQILLRDMAGCNVGHARLGQVHGMRAVMVLDPTQVSEVAEQRRRLVTVSRAPLTGDPAGEESGSGGSAVIGPDLGGGSDAPREAAVEAGARAAAMATEGGAAD